MKVALKVSWKKLKSFKFFKEKNKWYLSMVDENNRCFDFFPKNKNHQKCVLSIIL
jgi:hypothetical protein